MFQYEQEYENEIKPKWNLSSNKERKELEEFDRELKERKQAKIQAKLRADKANSPQEKEADRIAKEVVNGKGDVKEKVDQLQVQAKGKEEGVEVSPEISNAIQSELGKGQPLSKDLRLNFEKEMGYDFSNVKIHANKKSYELNKSLNSIAFTFGNDIFFSQDEYRPDAEEGKKLITHELTHVIQQNLINPVVMRKTTEKYKDQRKEKIYHHVIEEDDYKFNLSFLLEKRREYFAKKKNKELNRIFHSQLRYWVELLFLAAQHQKGKNSDLLEIVYPKLTGNINKEYNTRKEVFNDFGILVQLAKATVYFDTETNDKVPDINQYNKKLTTKFEMDLLEFVQGIETEAYLKITLGEEKANKRIKKIEHAFMYAQVKKILSLKIQNSHYLSIKVFQG